MFCKNCGMQQNVGAQFCKNCGQVLNPTVPSATQAGSAIPSVTQAAVAPPVNSVIPPFSVASTNAKPLIVAGAVIVILLLSLLIYRSSNKMNGAGSTPGDNFSATANIPLDQKLEDAIARGNLVTPPGENAYAYYQQLQSSGAKANVLARFNEKLMPLLTPRADEMIERITQPGNSDFTPAEWDEAARLSAWASEIKPNDKGLRARADYCLGRVAYLEKRADDALNLWQRASETDPAWAVPTNGVGLVYNEKKEYATARQYLHEAVRRNPNWAYPYNNIGTSYFYEKNYDQAEIYYRQAVERSPQWARPHAWLGDIAMHRKDYLRAAEEYQAVLDLAQSGAGANIDLNVIETKLARARQLVSQ